MRSNQACECLIGLPNDGVDAERAAMLVRDELSADTPPIYNLASFLTAKHSIPELDQLVIENLFKNMGEIRAYPGLAQIEQRCISILSHLFNVRASCRTPSESRTLSGQQFYGTSTVGSSEGILLAGLAMKRHWQEERRSQGKSERHPNIIIGSNAHTIQHKFANYFDVEERVIDVTEEGLFSLDAEMVAKSVDENTIGVFTVLGNNYTGHFDDIAEIAAALDQYEMRTGHDIPIHVDAAVGGFIAPFCSGVDSGPKWDFSIRRVQSINASGHKFSLAPPGVAWILWKNRSWYPSSLFHKINYLVSPIDTVSLNLSRSSAPLIAEYFYFKHLGFSGFQEMIGGFLAKARDLSDMIEGLSWFVCISDIHRPQGTHMCDGYSTQTHKAYRDPVRFNYGLPLVVFKFTPEIARRYHISLKTISLKMLEKGYTIPCYQLPTSHPQQDAMRIIVREEMTTALIEKLVTELSVVTRQAMGRRDSGIDTELVDKELESNRHTNVRGNLEQDEALTQHDMI